MKSPLEIPCPAPDCVARIKVTKRKSRIKDRPIRLPKCPGCGKQLKVDARTLNATVA